MATSSQIFFAKSGYFPNSGVFYDTGNRQGSGTVTDTPDSPSGDDTTLLGDISGDLFSFNSDTYQFVASVDSGGFVGLRTSDNINVIFRPGSYSSYNYYQVNSSAYAICFTSGVRIETVLGPVAVEKLAVGDVALTASGAERPIRWIGRRTVDCAGDSAHMAPVRVRANALGSNIPERDVFLSPGHPVLVRQDGAEVLVPIMNLINGTTIERTTMNGVTYWHVELDEHDVLLADGLPAESFFDMGSRGWFDDDLDDVLANPDLVPAGQHGRCRPVAVEGPLVEAERRRISELFYADLSAQCAWPTSDDGQTGVHLG